MFLLAKQTAGTFLVQETGLGWGRINWTFDQVGKLRVPVHESGLIASSKPVEPSSLISLHLKPKRLGNMNVRAEATGHHLQKSGQTWVWIQTTLRKIPLCSIHKYTSWC